VIKKVSIAILIVSLFSILIVSGCRQSVKPTPVEQLTIIESTVDIEFPLQLQFNLSAGSDVDISDIRLHYITERESYAQTVSEVNIEFDAATAVDVQWSWDMRKTGGLPPGSGIEYWWTVTDSSDDTMETIPEQVRFNDNRYDWQSISEEMVTIYWYVGQPSFAEQLMSAAQQALARLARDTGAHLKNPVEIYIYANTRDLQGAMVFPQEWTGGAAFTRYGIIVIGIEPRNISWGKNSMAHELTHLVIHQMTYNPYSSLPTWLEEGLATYNEGVLDPTLAAYLVKAIKDDSLISVRSLSSPFSAYSEQSYLSYAQSYSLVEFLITIYGQGKMLELLTAFSQGSNYDEALEKVYGFDMDVLNDLWQEYINPHSQGTISNKDSTIAATIGIAR